MFQLHIRLKFIPVHKSNASYLFNFFFFVFILFILIFFKSNLRQWVVTDEVGNGEMLEPSLKLAKHGVYFSIHIPETKLKVKSQPGYRRLESKVDRVNVGFVVEESR